MIRNELKVFMSFKNYLMEILVSGSAHMRPLIDTRNKFPSHMSTKSPSKISHNPSEVISKVSEL
jgi:hypothetical protein